MAFYSSLLGKRRLAAVCCGAWFGFAGLNLRADFQGSTHMVPFDEDTISYSKAEPSGPVAELQKKLDAGDVVLKYDSKMGYLPSLLEALNVPKSSQMLVFSKTSLQRERISPQTPRAIFFNDDVYIGFIPGAPMVEVSSVDPKLGGIFYTLDQKSEGKPRLSRNDQCLECHASAKSMGVPGHLVRSFATDESGVVDLAGGTSLVNHRTPFEERWGGWYVTGTHGDQPHRGNLFGTDAFTRHDKDPKHGGNLTDLSRFFDVRKYAEPGSDVVALMVLEHQTHMHNFIARLNYDATLALKQYGHINYLQNRVEAFVKYLLFAEEATLTGPIKGTSRFADEFASRGPKDKKGRSLRDFDLQTRLFKHPCSFLIYSDAFDNLPEKLKAQVYDRLHAILTGKDTTPAYSRLYEADRRAILEILIETKSDLPAVWKSGS